MEDAVTGMHRDMMAPPSGDVDRDFVTMMIPHHQGAVEMAEAELRFGHDPVLRRLTQGIIVEQRQEIAGMRQALAALPPASPHTMPSMGAPTPRPRICNHSTHRPGSTFRASRASHTAHQY